MPTLNEAPAAFAARPETGKITVETTIRNVGKGAFLPLTRDLLRPLGLEVGQAVRVTVRDGVLTMAPAEGAYARTREAAAVLSSRHENHPLLRRTGAAQAPLSAARLVPAAAGGQRHAA